MHVHGQEDEASRLQTVWGCQKDGGRRKRETRMKRDCKATLLKEAHLALQLHGQLKTIQYANRFQAHQHVEWSRWLRSRRNWIQRACIQEESHCHTAPPKKYPNTIHIQGTSRYILFIHSSFSSSKLWSESVEGFFESFRLPGNLCATLQSKAITDKYYWSQSLQELTVEVEVGTCKAPTHFT